MLILLHCIEKPLENNLKKIQNGFLSIFERREKMAKKFLFGKDLPVIKEDSEKIFSNQSNNSKYSNIIKPSNLYFRTQK